MASVGRRQGSAIASRLFHNAHRSTGLSNRRSRHLCRRRNPSVKPAPKSSLSEFLVLLPEVFAKMPPFVLLTILAEPVYSMHRQSWVILRPRCSVDLSPLRIAETKSVIGRWIDNSDRTTSSSLLPVDTKGRRCRTTDDVHLMMRPKLRCVIFVNCYRAMPWISQKHDTIWEHRQRGNVPVEGMALDMDRISQ